MKLLIIEDDKEIAGLLAVYLKKNGYDVTERYDGVAGLNELRAHTEDYGMILLDMMLPGFSGDELLPRFREITNIPVIVISAVSNLDERIGMMRSGADDYIIKPFELPDVLVRIEAVARRYSLQLRGWEGDGREGTDGKTTDRNGRTGRTGRTGGTDRTGGTGGSGRKPLSYGTIMLDTESAQVTVKGEPLGLTTKEYEILRIFMENPTKLFSKANLFESVWNEEYYPEDQALKVHMSNLRSKLRKMDDFDYIETVWGMGYRLRKLG